MKMDKRWGIGGEGLHQGFGGGPSHTAAVKRVGSPQRRRVYSCLAPGSSYVISQQVVGSGLYLVSGNDLVRDLNGPPSKPIEGSECASPSPSSDCLVWAYTACEL